MLSGTFQGNVIDGAISVEVFYVLITLPQWGAMLWSDGLQTII